jgi:hypothetical protein
MAFFTVVLIILMAGRSQATMSPSATPLIQCNLGLVLPLLLVGLVSTYGLCSKASAKKNR